MSSRNWRFYLSTFAANLLFISYGTIVGWHSPVIIKLKSNNTDINPLKTPITLMQVAICSSVFPIGSIIGTLLVTKLPDMLGRKKSILYLATIILISFIIMTFVNQFWMYILVLTILSICESAGTAVVPTYLSEIAKTKKRGKFGATVAISKSTGQFYSFLLGPITSFYQFSLFCAIPLLLHILLSFFTQESPIYLTLKGDKIGAAKCLKKLGREVEVPVKTEEINELLHQNIEKNKSFKTLFTTSTGRKIFLLAFLTRLLTVSSGIYIILFFLETLLQNSGSKLSGYYLSVIITFVKIGVSISCLFLIERIGRKILLMIGGFGCSISMLGLGIYLYCKSKEIYVPPIIPISCILLMFVFYNIGLGGVPYIIISEIIPNEVRASGTGTIFFLCHTLLMLSSFTYPLVEYHFGAYIYMFIFGISTFLISVILSIFLPETKGKTFGEIQNMLMGKTLA